MFGTAKSYHLADMRYDTVNAYIAAFPKEVQSILKKIRATIRKAAPGADESISYGIPTYKLNSPLVYFAAHKQHIGMYPVTNAIREKFAKDLSKYEGGKGTVRFPLDEPIPYPLITRIVKFMVQQKRKT
jgi:uncharacterized protein YdhG (YjbR/CyaY superfamily)